MRSSLGDIAGRVERCDGCERAFLIGERVYEYEGGELRCALCRGHEHRDPAEVHTVHTAAFGNSIRILDRRAAKRAA